MVQTHFNVDALRAQIVLRPNLSMGWRGNRIVIGLLAVPILGTGIGFALQGLWLILPFGALELTCVSAAIYYLYRRAQHQEVITITDEQVLIEAGRMSPDERCELARYWTSFRVRAPTQRWYDPDIVVSGPGVERVIGAFLSRADKDQLIADLRTIVSTLNQRHSG